MADLRLFDPRLPRYEQFRMRQTAIHECGHAVVAQYFDLEIIKLWFTTPGEPGPKVNGKIQIIIEGKPAFSVISTLRAGIEAERLLAPTFDNTEGSDDSDVELANELNAKQCVHDRAAMYARGIVRKWQKAIRRDAALLMSSYSGAITFPYSPPKRPKRPKKPKLKQRKE